MITFYLKFNGGSVTHRFFLRSLDELIYNLNKRVNDGTKTKVIYDDHFTPFLTKVIYSIPQDKINLVEFCRSFEYQRDWYDYLYRGEVKWNLTQMKYMTTCARDLSYQ